MTADSGRVPDAAAFFMALSGLPGMDDDLIRQAKQAITDAMPAGAGHQVFLERQMAIMQATAKAILGNRDIPDSGAPSDMTNQQLEQARACFDVAVDAVRALSLAANASDEESMDQVVRRFQEELSRVHDGESN